MAITGSIQTDAFLDRSPNRQCWLLFRAGPLSRLKQFQNGKMYMNSVSYFSELKGEEATALRKDDLEKNYLTLHSRMGGASVGELFVEIDGEEVSLGPDAIMRVDLPNPSNIFIFCMAALADGLDGLIPGEHEGKLTLSSRFAELGDHVLLVNNIGEFSRRMSAAILAHPHLYSSPFFEGGYGQVDYVDMGNHSGVVGLFRKDIQYAWQREYRFCLGCASEALNANGALELDIGDLSDITSIVPVEKFASQTFTLKRHQFEIKDVVVS
ncbi:hypothetical protein PS922_01037 [Pseudomonas fluorescens]|uniref:Uncharacterized protein n=2 Tax=Pseudomonas TaxID=286 RepID=A0A5E7RI24_PSEFL|nr:hypothetical protein PS922_01037 [Pseudomonas fluorescens]